MVIMLRCKIKLDYFVQCNILEDAGPGGRKTSTSYGQVGRFGPGKGTSNMVKSFEEMQKLGKDTVDATFKSMGAFSTSAQAIAVEMADYSRKAFEEGAI